MIRRISIFFLSVLWSILVQGQSIDSLKQQILVTSNDSVKYELYNQLFSLVIYKDLDSAKKYLDIQKRYLQAFSKSSNYIDFKIEFYNNSGVYYNRLGLFDSSVAAYQKVYALAEKTNKKRIMAIALNNIANVHYLQGNYPISLDYHLRSLKLRESIADTSGIAMSLGNIGLIYSSQKKYLKAIEYYKKAKHYFEKLANRQAIRWTNRMIGIAYLDLKQYNQAHVFLSKTRRQCELEQDKSGELYTLLNLGLLYIARYEEENRDVIYLDSAEKVLQRVSVLLNNVKNKRLELNYINNVAQVKIYRKKYAEALKLLNNAEASYNDIDLKPELKKLYRLKSEALEGLEKYKSALEAYKQFKRISDTIFNVEKDKEIGKKEAWLGYNEKLKIAKLKSQARLQQEKLKKERLRLWIIVLVFLGLIVSIVSVFIFLKLTKERRLLRQQKNQILSKYNNIENAYNEVLSNFDDLKKKYDDAEGQCKILPDWISSLSKRETEVLSCLAIGLSDKEISNKLFISVTTVRTHCQRIYGKLLVKNRSEAAHLAREYHLI